MNKILNIFCWLEIMLELYWRQPRLTYNACEPFIKHRERIQKFRETGNLKHICENELGKTCFAHDAVYSDRKDLANTTIPDKILKDIAYEIARNKKYERLQWKLVSTSKYLSPLLVKNLLMLIILLCLKKFNKVI